MDLREYYTSIGEDYDAVYRRLLSAERIEKYLALFFNDNPIDKLKQQIICNDSAAAMETAHTLKGILSTLGIDHLVGILCELHDALKNDALQNAEMLSRQLEKHYETVYQVWMTMNTPAATDCQSHPRPIE